MADPILQQIHVDTLYDYRLMLADGRPVLGVIGGGHEQPFTAQEKVAIAAHAVACWNAGAENAALHKQLNAAKIIIAAKDERSIQQARKYGELMRRASDVAGERKANAILTSENEVLTARVKVLEDAIALAYGHLWCINAEHGTPAPMRIPEAAAHDARMILLDLITKEQRGNGIDAARAELRSKP